MKILYLFCLIVLNLFGPTHGSIQEGISIQDLGSNWKFQQAGTEMFYNATVPGTVHLDLLRNELIEDPYYRDNVNKVQWIENKTWDYISEFDITTLNLLDHDRVEMVFEGLDTHATVFLNGILILEADNMFRTWVVEVKNLLQPTSNVLKVIFDSPVLYDTDQILKLKSSLNLTLPSDFDSGRIFTRKAAYHFGWDWGPRLVTCGIWRPVYLQGWTNAKIKYVQINQHKIENNVANLEANLELVVADEREYEIKVLNAKTGETYFRSFTWIEEAKNLNFALSFRVKNPKLWWVRNLGEPHLYTFIFQIFYDGKLLDQKNVTTGLRTVQLIRENDEIGQSFYFKINGQRVFAKGGNYIPPDLFLPRVTRQDYEAVLKNAIDANYNFIRVWGGGTFEDDIFYEICDREGILLWQDFLFGNGMYPAFSSKFVNNIKKEIIDNVKRLRNHPSIALWCGNNEIKNGWDDWGYQDNMTDAQRHLVHGWYSKIFLEVIPSVLEEIDPSRPYWPTSPEIGYGHNESFVRGDNHYYGVWVLNASIENYTLSVGRFMSEYGMQGLLCMNSIKKFTIPEDLDLNSTVILAHEKGPGAYGHIDVYMQNYYKPTQSLEMYLYATQIMQKLAIQTAIEAHRCGKPRNMGTLMWQLNDVWPSFSWSAVDYYGTWKAVHYMVKKKFQDVLVSIVKDVDAKNRTHYGVQIVSEKLFDFKGSLNFAVRDLDGTPRLTSSMEVNVPKDSSELYYEVLFSNIQNLNPNKTFIEAKLSYDFDEQVSETIGFLVRPVHLTLENPTISIVLDLLEDTAIVQTDTLIIGTYLYVDGVDLHFDDNYFDLLPGTPRTIKSLKTSLRTIPNIEKELKVLHLYMTYAKNSRAPKISVVGETN